MIKGKAKRVTIFVSESDRYHHRPLYAEIVHQAHLAGLAGASVFRGMEGFGAAARIHTNRLLSLAQDLPLAIVIVDAEPAVSRFLAGATDLLADCLVLVDDVQVYSARGASAGPAVSADTA